MTGDYNNKINFVETMPDFEEMIGALKTQKMIGVDLEADSMFHFKERVCLIQIATAEACYIVDSLALKDLSLLRPVFGDASIQKIFHGADYDIRSLYRDFKIEVANLFDTELATRFLGYRETGLGSVIFNRFGVQLNKKYQKKDWSVRPLTGEMIEYGAWDVIFLIRLAKTLTNELKAKQREKWLKEEFDLLSKVRQSKSKHPLFLRFKGAGRLNPRSLALLEALLEFRIKIARQKDKPLFKVFGNQTLKDIAQKKPEDHANLKNIDTLSKKQILMYGDELLKLVRIVKRLPVNDLPLYPPQKSIGLNREVIQRINRLKDWRDQLADQLKIDPAQLFNKAMLNAIAQRNPKQIHELNEIEHLKEWQKKEFGHMILEILNCANIKLS